MRVLEQIEQWIDELSGLGKEDLNEVLDEISRISDEMTETAEDITAYLKTQCQIEVSEVMLERLRVEIPSFPHLPATLLSQEEWEQGSPCCWSVAILHGNLTVLQDSGYGYIALFDGDTFVSVSNSSIEYEDVLVLSNRYTSGLPALYKKIV